ncbi:MAG TPA: TIGR02186 family protein [Enterovirga sp.]
MTRLPLLPGALAAMLAGLLPASAERLVLSVSSPQVAIASNFTGTQVVMFGVIERDSQSIARAGAYDVVITVRGPREAITVRRKEAFGPIWLNRDQQKFVAVPALLAVYATRPIRSLAGEPLRRKLRLGIDAVIDSPEYTIDRGARDDPFRQALVRLKARERLYVEHGSGVAFLTEDVFRAPIQLPATAPLGNYDVEATLLADGVVLSRRSAHFSVVKAGFEEQITELARDRGMLYGLGTAAMALAFGWLASVIFRRD